MVQAFSSALALAWLRVYTLFSFTNFILSTVSISNRSLSRHKWHLIERALPFYMDPSWVILSKNKLNKSLTHRLMIMLIGLAILCQLAASISPAFLFQIHSWSSITYLLNLLGSIPLLQLYNDLLLATLSCNLLSSLALSC